MNNVYLTLSIFFKFLEIFLLAYLVISWLPGFKKVKSIIYMLISPLVIPIRFLLNKSVMKVRGADFSIVIAYVIVDFLSTFFIIN